MKYCIVNADDFGASNGINRGIIEAHQRGILTSTSLMVNMPKTAEAVALSRNAPKMSVGLHVNFTNEGDNPVVDICDLQACQVELSRQFCDFVTLMGRLPTHLDAHHNIHRDPLMQSLFVALARQYELPLREHSPVRYFSSFYGQWDGETHLEQISVTSLCQMLETEFYSDFTELSCHPGYLDSNFDSVYAIEREAELATLCNPVVPRILRSLSLRLINYQDLRRLAPITVC